MRNILLVRIYYERTSYAYIITSRINYGRKTKIYEVRKTLKKIKKYTRTHTHYIFDATFILPLPISFFSGKYPFETKSSTIP